MKTKKPLVPFIVAIKPIIGIERGTHNGYVAIPPNHPLYGRDIFDIEDEFKVHGGITLSEPASWVKGNTPLLNDAEYISGHTEIPNDYWIFGFDTSHWGDNPINCNRDYVVKETMGLLEQLEDLYV